MRKKTIAFYDVLLYTIICGPLMLNSIIILYLCELNDFEWLLKHWYLVALCSLGIILFIAGRLLFRSIEISSESIYFIYFPYGSWEKAVGNIDALWNQNVFISEIKDIEIVKLTKEEKRTKVYYKHWFNKYLKINLKYGNPKYVYVGNYSKYQINKLIRFVKLVNEK